MSQNLDRLKEAYRQWDASKGASIDAWLALVADQADFCSLAQGRPTVEFSARRGTRDEVRGYLEALTAEWAMIHYTPEYFIEQGDRIVMFGATSWRNKRTGKEVETAKADFWRFEDGKAVAFYERFDTAALLAAAQP